MMNKSFLDKVEAWEVELVMEPSFHEAKYVDGADLYITHHVANVQSYGFEEDEEVEVFFAEHNHVKALRERIRNGESDECELIEITNQEYDAQFNYDKVVAFRLNSEEVKWVC